MIPLIDYNKEILETLNKSAKTVRDIYAKRKERTKTIELAKQHK